MSAPTSSEIPLILRSCQTPGALARPSRQALGEAPAANARPSCREAYADVPAFLARLRERQGGSVSALALEFVILTAARSGEALGMRWNEVDETAKVWTVPPAA